MKIVKINVRGSGVIAPSAIPQGIVPDPNPYYI